MINNQFIYSSFLPFILPNCAYFLYGFSLFSMIKNMSYFMKQMFLTLLMRMAHFIYGLTL